VVEPPLVVEPRPGVVPPLLVEPPWVAPPPVDGPPAAVCAHDADAVVRHATTSPTRTPLTMFEKENGTTSPNVADQRLPAIPAAKYFRDD
jgi:hypothetical protein